jgi:hypothetical protein
VASAALKRNQETTKLYNPWEGRLAGRQLTETVEEFLARLPPSTSARCASVPWIFIANPFIACQQPQDIEGIEEGPRDEGSTLGELIVVGQKILSEFDNTVENIKGAKKGKSSIAINQAIGKERTAIVKKIQETAKTMKCTSGKVCLTSSLS